MSDLVSDGFIRVTWAPAVANIAAPTVAEINAGLRLDTVMTPAGLKVAPTTALVDTSSLSSTFDTARSGKRGFVNSVIIKAQDSADTALTTLVYRASGFLVIRRKLASATAPAIGDKVEVYPSQCDEPIQTYGPNTIQAFEVGMKMTSDANTNAVTA